MMQESRPKADRALLWAVAGAALFLGVGAALPVWRVPPRYPPSGVGPGDRGPLWRSVGYCLGEDPLREVLDATPSAVRMLRFAGWLLAAGATAGLLGYGVYRDSR